MTLGSARPLIPNDIDGPEHTEWRRLLDPMFSPKQVALLADSIHDLADQLIDGFTYTGGSARVVVRATRVLTSLTTSSVRGASSVRDA